MQLAEHIKRDPDLQISNSGAFPQETQTSERSLHDREDRAGSAGDK